MAPKFGTSGLRGLVTELTDAVCAGHSLAFLEGAETDGTVLIGRDLRASSPRIAAAVAAAASELGLVPLDCGVLPTPALALAGIGRGTASIMVTGSHIPDDRNGLKFHTRDGEITKADEGAIAAGYERARARAGALSPGTARREDGPLAAYRDRYSGFFGADALAGLRIGVYEHSSAARDLLGGILRDLGAETVGLGRSEQFVPVDTEAVEAEMRDRLGRWAEAHRLDAIVSTDGDADRPMVADAAGRVIPGDRLGPLTALWLGAEVVVTPVSSNTLVDVMGRFEVIRTRIGSPFVIAGMEAQSGRRVVGYEANGGFLLGFSAERGRHVGLHPCRRGTASCRSSRRWRSLRERGTDLAALDAGLPARFTATDRLTGIAPERGAALLAALEGDAALRERLFGAEAPAEVDRTDGYRARFADGRIAHLRPSGNAPEFRVYTEAETPGAADAALAALLGRVGAELG